MKNNNNLSNPLSITRRVRQKGAISRIILIGGAFILVVIIIIIVLLAVRSGSSKKNQNNSGGAVVEPSLPVYEKQIGDINFTLDSSEDLGNILKAQNQYQKDVTTTERFIQVVIGAQNKGKMATGPYNWDLGNIVDSDGRIFPNVNNAASSYLPNPNPCGLSLKPEFYPVSCTKIYEVSKISKGLKIEITVKDKPAGFLDLKLGQ